MEYRTSARLRQVKTDEHQGGTTLAQTLFLHVYTDPGIRFLYRPADQVLLLGQVVRTGRVRQECQLGPDGLYHLPTRHVAGLFATHAIRYAEPTSVAFHLD